jgi:hypothetical protein
MMDEHHKTLVGFIYHLGVHSRTSRTEIEIIVEKIPGVVLFIQSMPTTQSIKKL